MDVSDNEYLRNICINLYDISQTLNALNTNLELSMSCISEGLEGIGCEIHKARFDDKDQVISR